MPTRVSRKKSSTKDKVAVIRCMRCGAEIIVESNVKLMSEAIEVHVEQHRSKLKNPLKAEAEAVQIQDDLIAQVFDAASKQ